MDKVWIYGIRCRSRIGVSRAERRRPQNLLVDLGLDTDIAAAAARDDLRLAVDYKAVADLVRGTAALGERALIETLAELLAQTVLRACPGVFRVSVTVHKRPASMPRVREVAVVISRERLTRIAIC
ncbi:MAG: dihydroneopterin aldolase [Elusimicrobiota bacterium]|jgi:dihydroneopterin aldolase